MIRNIIPTSSIFKSYDIRGIYPDEINEDNIYLITQSILKFFQDQAKNTNVKVGVSHDMRLSAPKLYPGALQALKDGGACVWNFDLLSTPTFYFAVSHNNLPFGFILSASHNSPRYTGFKIVTNINNKIIKVGKNSGLDTIKKYSISGLKNKHTGGVIIERESILKDEVDSTLSKVDISKIKPIKIVVDAANAMGSLYIEELFSRLPCKLVKMNFNLDGSFPAHDPNPLVDKNLIDVRKKVVEVGADLGIAPDGDGDRIIFIDENGEKIPASFLGSLIIKKLLQRYKGATIMFSVTEILTPRSITEEMGGKFIITPVGHTHITNLMHQSNALFAGEISGHYFFKDTGGTESGVFTIVNVLEILSSLAKPISQLIHDVRRSFASGEYNFSTDKADIIMERLKSDYKSGSLMTIDGIAVDYPTWRFSVRSSNTEPLIRLNVEARTQEGMKVKLNELINKIKALGAKKHND